VPQTTADLTRESRLTPLMEWRKSSQSSPMPGLLQSLGGVTE
jgi:hypothetical protein